MNKRLQQIIDYYELTPYAFSVKIGVSEGVVRKILKENTAIRSDNLEKISQTFTDINIDWLITGRGDMLLNTASTPTQHPLQTLPLIPFDALAGIPSIDNFGIAFADCDQYYIPEFAARGTDFLIRVSGSSMYPKYSNGDLLACTLVRDILFFQWGKVYVIDSSQGVLVKRIFPSNHPDCISLVSDNSEHYPPFDFPKSDIRTLAIVSGVIRFE